ncbi:hypothetical protein F751_6510 [Auxenochlorella protothecoides]|uniref:CRAL-TRIO domain-containing protein n=1 Tax=Auxenochlorella protothecoides TaxID=3075 RepID=A0A087STD7_AUXPR|nr:hypothetical protein F751_6510 [Auxenochlorella protothecoides]KFM28991.1 hypothetical protein F751_6510 [Auxenochlorella protothecoides]
MGREASMEIERRGASFEGLAPLKSALVTLKAYHKGSHHDASSQAYKALYKQQYLLILTAGSFRLYSTREVEEGAVTPPTPDDNSDLGQELETLRSTLLPSAGKGELRATSVTSSPQRPCPPASPPSDQMLCVSIALSSLLQAEVQPGGLLTLSFEPDEARTLAQAAREAAARLACALAWLDRGLPLPSERATVALVAAVDPGGGTQRVVATAPAWGAALAVPESVARAARTARGARGFAPAAGPLLRVWVSTGLGVVTLDLSPHRLAQAWDQEGAGEPGTKHAALVVSQRLPKELQRGTEGGSHLAARLECTVGVQGPLEALAEEVECEEEDACIRAVFVGQPVVAPQPPRTPQPGPIQRSITWADQVAPPTGPGRKASRVPGSMVAPTDAALPPSSPTGRDWRAELSRPAAAALAAAASLMAASLYAQAPLGNLPRWVTTVALPFCVLACGLGRRLGPGSERGPWWQSIEIVEERTLMPSLSVSRTLSWSGLAPASTVHAALPPGLLALTRAHPGVLTPDVAARFLAGLETEARAAAAMRGMVDFVTSRGMLDVAFRPQPAFAAVKRHYTHGLLGRARDGSVVELECLSQLPAAYPRLAREGVGQDELLAHLMFTYEYVFKVLDTAPLPGGKTYKIVDLGALSMGDLRSEGFKFISKAGALLAVNFPQRLHRAFLVNAPSWWSLAWKLVSPLITKKVRERMVVFGRGQEYIL